MRVWRGEGPPLVRLELPNTRRRFSAGQWLFVCFPRAGVLQWHPFTISSSVHDDQLTVHMKCAGKWTQEVAALADVQADTKVCCCACRGRSAAAMLAVSMPCNVLNHDAALLLKRQSGSNSCL